MAYQKGAYEENKEAVKVILRIYHKGADKIITAETLGDELHIAREYMRKMINDLRKEGVPICSSNKGFYYAATVEELFETIMSLQARVEDIQKCIRGLSRTWDKMR